LDGVPISIKGNIAVKGFPLTANSNILNDTSTFGYDCVIGKKLQQAGAIIVGITNMDEFGMGSLGTHSNNGYTVNPLPFLKDISQSDYIAMIQRGDVPLTNIRLDEDAQHVILSPGGSSSGSAASVSMGSSIISIGTDTGGSIRLPAAWCGIVGMKPTYGAISRDGVVSYASSLDTVGILGPSTACVGYTLDMLRNVKPETTEGETDDWYESVKDSTACYLDAVVGWGDDCKQQQHPLKGMTVGIPAAFSVDGCSTQVKDAWTRSMERLMECGATISVVSQDYISPETVKLSLPAYYVLSCAEASSNLARYDGLRYGSSHSIIKTNQSREAQYAYTRSKGFGREVQRRILAGTAVLSSDRFHTHYEGAANIRAAMTKQFQNAFECGGVHGAGIDVMLIPTVLSGPPVIAGKGAQPLDSTEAFQNDVMTVPISLAGLPSISVPVDVSSGGGTTIGMQIFGPRKSEREILRAAHALHG
jgi:aspartyl-tRNA(Asn)/glutamyl-tRNA(Gln) amidotransferase subunit A